MTKTEPSSRSSSTVLIDKKNSLWTIVWVVGALGFCLPVVTIIIPRATLPSKIPALRIPKKQFRSIIRDDYSFAAAPLRSKTLESAVVQLYGLYQEQGAGEVEVSSGGVEAHERERKRNRLLAELPEKNRAWIVRKVCAKAVVELDQSGSERMWVKKSAELLGSFPAVLERYSAVSHQRVLAPWEVIRTLFKARCYAIFNLPLTYQFKTAESSVYYGWLAFHASNAPWVHRMDALDKFAQMGGSQVADEVMAAKGFLLAKSGSYAQAAHVYQEAFARTGQLWLRNYALGTLSVVGGEPTK